VKNQRRQWESDSHHRTSTEQALSGRERFLLGCGVVGPPLFVIVFLIEGATRAHYSPLRHPVSSLSIGEFGWVQKANFMGTGALMIGFAVGLGLTARHAGGGRSTPLLIGLFGLGLIGAGVFNADPISGFPSGTPMIAAIRSVHGQLHDLAGTPVFLGLPVACIVMARQLARAGRRGWATYSIVTAVAFLICFILADAGFAQFGPLMPIGGLLQRLTIIIGWGWLTAFAVYVLARRPVRAAGERLP
jgi:hypothetical membrane protein